jgi:hypothetical protein
LFESNSTDQVQEEEITADQQGQPTAGFYGCTRQGSQGTNNYGHRRSATNFYGRSQDRKVSTRPPHGEAAINFPEHSPDHHAWQPGEYLPSGSTQQDIFSLVSEMQGVITAEIQKVQASVETLAGRVNKLENDLSSAEHCSHRTPSSSASGSLSSTDSSTEKSGRKRCIPTALAVNKYWHLLPVGLCSLPI